MAASRHEFVFPPMSIKGCVRRIRCRLLVVTNTASQKNRTADKYGFSQLHTNREESKNGDIWSVIGQSGLKEGSSETLTMLCGRFRCPIWVDFCQSGPASVLVKSDANDLPSRMQMSGQVQCKWGGRLSAITHPRGQQQCGVGPIWKGSMRAHIQPPSKPGVTGVTSVTPFTKRPVSLAFMPVTQLSDIAYPPM